MPEISTAQKYARIFGMPEEDIAHADYDIFTNILTVTYGIDKPRYKQKQVTRRASKEFADFFKAPIFVGKSVDYILTAYLKAKGINPVIREGQRPVKLYYTSTDPVFGKMTLRQFIETEVKERGNYTLADVQNWMRRYNISGNDLAIWVSPKKWVANRYNLPASEWDKAKYIPESEMNVYEIRGDGGFVIPESDDGEEGYLFVFKRELYPMVREAVNHVPDQHERANKIIEEIKASGLSPKEKRKKIGEGLKALADGIDKGVYTAIRDLRPLGIMSEIGMLMGAQPRKGVRVDTPFGAYVFDNKRVPSKEMVDSWYAQHKEAETIHTLAVEYAFGLEAHPNTVTGNFRVVEHARRLRAQGLLAPEEELVLSALEKYWQEHPELDRKEGYGVWGYNLEIMVPERLRTAVKPEVISETTTAGIRAGDTIIHRTAKYTAVVDKVYKNGNADITVLEAKGIPEWEKSIKEGFPIKTTVKGVDIDRYFEKVSPRLAEEQKSAIKGTEAKQPWEMTYREFADYFRDVWAEQHFTFAEQVGKPMGILSQGGAPYHIIHGKKIGYSGSSYRDIWRLAIVDKALSEGKTVPGDVLTELSESLKKEKEKLGGTGTAEQPQKQSWQMTRDEYTKQEWWQRIYGNLTGANREAALSLHKVSVQQALESGKPVPPEVLKDYPDLTTMKKEPWEMTYREFADFFEDVYGGQKFTFAERVGKPLGILSQAGEPYHMIKGRRIGYSGSLSRDRWRLAIVDKALSEGKKVPEEVLAELSESLKHEKEKLGGTGMAEPQEGKPLSQEEMENRFRALLNEAKEKGFIEHEKEWIDRFNDPTRSKENTILDLEGLIKTMEKRTPPAAVGSPYEVKATVSFIPRERVWSTVLEDSTGYPHGAQNYHSLKEALNALETRELEQDFDRESARQFYIRQMGLDPENPDDLKQIMTEYSEGHDPRRGIKIKEILYTDEVKAQKVLVLEHQFTSRELDALNIEELKKIALTKGAKTTGKKEEVAAAILQSQGAEKPVQEKKLYRYYFLHRPPDVGTMPDNPVRTERWVLRSKTPLGYDAFGWAEYDRPLTNDEIKHFELFVDEPVLPKLVKELVQFAHDEGIDEAMRAIVPDDEYYRAVMAWLKAVGRERPQVNPMVQVRDEVIRLAGITEKEKPVEAQPAAKPKIEPKVTDTQLIHERAKKVAEWWFNSQMKNPFTEFYLYHKVGDFRVAIETPEGYNLSDAQRISPAWTKEQAEQWIFDKVQRLPILPLMPVTPLPLYSPRAEPTYKEIIRTQQIKGWTVKYKFEWKSAMNYYSGFIWVSRGIGEGIRTAIINIKSPDEIPKEIDKAIAEAEKVTQKPMLESADALYKRYTSGYSYVSLLGIVQQDIKDMAHSIGYELKLDTAIYTPAVLLQYAEKFKEFAQRDYDIEHKKHEARKEKEQAEKEKEKREGGEAFWNEVKDLKVIDFEVQHDVNPDRPTRTYFHVYDRTIATLENGKRVQISYVINKGEYGKRALKATKEYYMTMYGQYMGKPLSDWITYDRLMINNRYEDYKAQVAKQALLSETVLERFPTKEYLEPKIREYGKWIRENTYGEAGVRKLQTGSYEEVIATIKEFIRKYYNLAPAPADYIFRRPAYQQTEIGIDSLANTFFNVAANGWDLAKTFKEWEAGETRQEWDRRLKELEKPQPLVKPVVKPEERILGELRTKYRFSRPEGDMVAKAIDSYIKIRDKPIVYSILSPVRDGKFIADDLIEMVEGTYWLKKEAPVSVPLALPAAKVQSIQEIKQQAVQSIQQAKTIDELKQVLKGIGFMPLPETEKRQVMDLYQNRFTMLQAEKPFGAPVKAEEKARVIGVPSRQELMEAEMRRKAEEGKKLRGQVELGGAVATATRLELFEPGAMEKARAEAEARKRIEQLGLPYTIHPVIKKLAESKEYILKFGAVTGKETFEDTILSRYKPYCPPGTIVDNKGIKGQRERWWVYPDRLRACMTEVQQKIAAAAVSAGVAMVKESTLSPSMRNYIQGAQAVRDVIHYFRDRRPPVRGVLYRARAGTYFVEAQDGQVYASMGWEDVYGAGMPAARAGAICR